MAGLPEALQLDIGNLLKLHFNDQVREFNAVLGRVAASPSPEAVHKLRVVNRKIRTVLWLLKRDKNLPSFRALSRRLKRLGRLLGEVREIDVTSRILHDFHARFSGLRQKRRARAEEVTRYLAP